MPQIRIPRQLTSQNLLERKNWLYVFVHASADATCAVIYHRGFNKTSNEIKSSLDIGKCKVASAKHMSFPKLEELEAFVTGIRLLNFVQ